MHPMEEIVKAIAEEEKTSMNEIVKIVDNTFADFTINGFKIKNKEISIPFEKNKIETHGFINFDLDWKSMIENWSFEVYPMNKRIVVEYSSPNIAKPMHVGHLRSTLIGNSFANLLNALGNDVIRINYLGDTGTQFGKLIYAFEHWGNEEELKKDPIKHLLELYVKFHKEANEEMEEEAKKIYSELERGNPRYLSLWKKIKELSLTEFKKVYEFFGVNFDVIEGESDYINLAKKYVEELKQKGIVSEEEGSIKYKNNVLIKSDGSTIYLSRDLAAAIERYKKFHFDEMYYVVANEQKHHFKILFELLKFFGIENCKHLSFGLVNLPEGKLSTRQGKIVLVKDIVNSVYSKLKNIKLTRNAIAFWMLKTHPERDITFRWEDLISIEGRTGVYLSYAYARAKKLIEDYDYEFMEPNEFEKALLRALSFYPIILRKAYLSNSPHVIANYAYNLATTFNKFYENCPVLNSDRKNFRIKLVELFVETMERLFNILGMLPLEEM